MSKPVTSSQVSASPRYADDGARAHVTLESMSDAVVTVDTQGNIDYLNPVAA